jgi:hypothetical protein
MIYGEEDCKKERTALEGHRVIMSLVAFGGVSVVLLSRPMLALLAPGSYDVAALGLPVALIVCSTPWYVEYLKNVNLLMARRRSAMLSWLSPAASVAAMASFAVLLKLGTDSLVSAALVPIIGYVLLAVGTGYYRRRLGFTKRTIRATLAACSAIASAALLEQLLDHDVLGWIVRVFAICALTTLLLINVVTVKALRGRQIWGLR